MDQRKNTSVIALLGVIGAIISLFCPFFYASSIMSYLINSSDSYSLWKIAHVFYQVGTKYEQGEAVFYALLIYLACIVAVVFLAVSCYRAYQFFTGESRILDVYAGPVVSIVIYVILIFVFWIITSGDNFKYVDIGLTLWPFIGIASSILAITFNKKVENMSSSTASAHPTAAYGSSSYAPQRSPATSNAPTRPGFWKCPQCGTANASYVSTCKCGLSKSAADDFTKSNAAKLSERKLMADSIVVPVVNYSAESLVQVTEVVINKESACIRLNLSNYNAASAPKAIRANIELISVFGDMAISANDVAFLTMTKKDGNRLSTEFTSISLSPDKVREVASARVVVSRLVYENGTNYTAADYMDSDLPLDRLKALRDAGYDAVCEKTILGDVWRCSCGRENSLADLACPRCGESMPGINGSQQYGANSRLLNAADFEEFKNILNEEISKGNKEYEKLLDELWSMRAYAGFDRILEMGKSRIRQMNAKK